MKMPSNRREAETRTDHPSRDQQIETARYVLEHADDPIWTGQDIALAHEILNYWRDVDRTQARRGVA